METSSINFECDKDDISQECFEMYQWSNVKSMQMTQMACKCCEEKCNKMQTCGLSPPITQNSQQQQQPAQEDHACPKTNGHSGLPMPHAIFTVFLFKLI